MSNEGYINHQKGIVFTQNGTSTIAYYVSLENSSNGNQLVIKYAVNNGSGFGLVKSFKPLVPYRVIIGDPRTLQDLENNNSFSSQVVSTNKLLFNPGVTYSGGKLGGIGTIGYNGDCPFIELNLSRSQLTEISKSNRIWQRRQYETSPGSWDHTNNNAIFIDKITYIADDTRASIMAKNISSSEDELYVSLTTQIRIKGSFADARVESEPNRLPTRIIPNTLGEKLFTYSLPVFLRFVIDRTNLPTNLVRPNDWRYLFYVSDYAKSSTDYAYGISKIQEDQGTNFLTSSWAYNLIANQPIKSSLFGIQYRYLSPMNLLCLWDISQDKDNNFLGMSAVARQHSSLGQVPFRTLINFNYSDFGTGDGFVETTGKVHSVSQGWFVYNISSASIESESGVLIVASMCNLKGEKRLNLLFWNGTTYSSANLTPGMNGTITKIGNSFALTYYAALSAQNGVGYSGATKITTILLPSLVAIKAFNETSCDIGGIEKTSILGFTHFSSVDYKTGPEIKVDPTNSSNRIFTLPGQNVTAVTSSILEVSLFSTLKYWETHYFVSNIEKLNNIKEGVAYNNSSGTPSGSYFRVRGNDSNSDLSITSYNTQPLNISGIASMGYWGDSNFNYDRTAGGIKVIFVLNGCSGVFRSGNGTSSDWIGTTDGGVPVNYTYTRPDLLFQYGGYYNEFSANPSSGYWATLLNSNWKLQLVYNNIELIASSATRSLYFYCYNTSGVCAVHVSCYLDLENVRDSGNFLYTDPNFALHDVDYTLTIDDVTTSGKVDIDPPNPSGVITTSVYKTVSNSINFTMTRDANTTIPEVGSVVNGIPFGKLKPYTDTTTLSDTINIGTNNLKNGDVINISYKPMYRNSRGTQANSRFVTFVKGHKYTIDNVDILIDGTSKTSEIKNSSDPWVYVNPGNPVPVRITVDVNHASYAIESYPSLNLVYPVITASYMLVIPKSYVPPTLANIALEERPPKDAPLTYPNCSYYMAWTLKVNYSTATFKDSNSYGGSTIDLSGDSLSTTVTEGGDYHIYYVIEDEFGQCSAWCITNLKNNYNIPFWRT